MAAASYQSASVTGRDACILPYSSHALAYCLAKLPYADCVHYLLYPPISVDVTMFIKIVGPPLTSWHPLPYVKAWLAKDRRDATSLHGMARAMDVPQPGSMMESVWNIL